MSRSCSTTITVFPISFNDFNVVSSLSLSLGCNPMEGSSKTYKTPVSWEPTWEASLILCASPPDKVRDARSNVK